MVKANASWISFWMKKTLSIFVFFIFSSAFAFATAAFDGPAGTSGAFI